MFETTRMYSRNGRLLTVVTGVVLGLMLFDIVWSREWAQLVRYSGPLGLFTLLLWAALWSPYVECSPAGVRLENVLTSVMIPWPAVRAIDTRFGLSLDTTFGTFAAWSVSRPRMRSGHPDETDVQPSVVVTHAWEELKRAGHLETPRLESDAHPRRWRVEVLATALGLALWTIATRALLG